MHVHASLSVLVELNSHQKNIKIVCKQILSSGCYATLEIVYHIFLSYTLSQQLWIKYTVIVYVYSKEKCAKKTQKTAIREYVEVETREN